MKLRLFLLAFLLSPMAMAEVKWSYEGGVLTQLDAPEGKTPWEFNLTAAGVLTKKTIGTGPVLDLREETLPSGVTITGSFPRLVNGVSRPARRSICPTRSRSSTATANIRSTAGRT